VGSGCQPSIDSRPPARRPQPPDNHEAAHAHAQSPSFQVTHHVLTRPTPDTQHDKASVSCGSIGRGPHPPFNASMACRRPLLLLTLAAAACIIMACACTFGGIEYICGIPKHT
jgi:hypothetical protein